ncbi:MAG: tetratricopeptide repeat protein [Planctomycetaceae bacterium]|nr:tetratricopeptide repeat protein [Planctomycetaceae bacterium]
MVWINPYRLPTGDPVPSGMYVTRSPAYLLWTLWGFAVSWFETRQVSRSLLGLPAVILAAVLVILMLSSSREASSNTISFYLTKAQQATRLKEFDDAEFYFRKLGQLAPRDGMIKYEHARLYSQQGDYGTAAALLHKLINDDDRTNDKKVHLDLARWAIEGGLEVEDPAGFAKEHLNRVLAEDPKDAYAHFFFSQLFWRAGDLDGAIEHLEPVASRAPELRLKLAAYYDIRGDANLARSEARLVVSDLQKAIRGEQSTDISVWMQLAAAHLLLSDYEQAASVMQQAVTKFENDGCRRFLGRIYARWSLHVSKENPENVNRRMELLQQAILVAPDEPEALTQLVNIANEEGEGSEQAERWLKEALVTGEGKAVIHFLLGTIAAGKGDMETALRHLEQSNEANPRTAVTLNNVAFVLAHMPDPDLPRALEMSNQAVRLAPNNASFLETRGQIYTRMGEYSKAITDLEKAIDHVTSIATRINAHESLAICYENLGDAELAQLHRKEAENLRQQIRLQNGLQEGTETEATIPDLDLQDDSPNDRE